MLALWHLFRYRNDDSRYSDLLRAEQSGDRIPVGARFSAFVQTGPGAYSTSWTVGSGFLSRGNMAGAWCWLATPSSAEVKGRENLCLNSSSEPSWPVIKWTVFYFYLSYKWWPCDIGFGSVFTVVVCKHTEERYGVCLERTGDCEWYIWRDVRGSGHGLTSHSVVCVEWLVKTTNNKENIHLRDRVSNPEP